MTGDQNKNVMRGEPPEDDDDAGSAAGDEKPDSITAIPKTNPKAKPSADGDMAPEPT